MSFLESKKIEFKREYMDDIKYAVVAFANTDGGKLYIGINDDGTVKGVENVDDTLLRLTNMIRDTIHPDVTMFVDYQVEELEGKSVVVVVVQRGTARPYYLHSKGLRPAGVYVRQAASSVPASENAILQMIKETSGDCYEDARSINQQLTFATAERFFADKSVAFGDSQKRTLNIISEDGTYSNLGMLLSDQCSHTIKLAVFQGSTKTVFHNRKEVTGSLFQQLEEAVNFLGFYNQVHGEVKGLERVDTLDYPPEAIREALLNVAVHRDYSVSGSALISMFDDRLEFLSIGGLAGNVTYNDIMLGVSSLRNKHLANVFYRLKLIEAYGTGLMKIRECYAGERVQSKIEISDNAFKVTLPNINFQRAQVVKDVPSPADAYRVRPRSREERVLALAQQQGSILRKDVEELLGVSQATAALLLRKMTQEQLLVREGNGRSCSYLCK